MSFRSVSVKLFGQPPPKDSAQSVRLCYIRRILVRDLLFVVPLYAVVIAISAFPTWLRIAFAVGAVIYVANVASISIRIRRARQREQAAS